MYAVCVLGRVYSSVSSSLRYTCFREAPYGAFRVRPTNNLPKRSLDVASVVVAHVKDYVRYDIASINVTCDLKLAGLRLHSRTLIGLMR